MPTTKPKRPEIVLATWPNRTGVEFLGDRNYPNANGCVSMWIAFRVVDDESYSTWRLKDAIRSIGLWVWMATDSDSIHVEFRAHEVYSATVTELELIVGEMRRLNKRIPARLHGESYSTYVCRVLQEVGIKRCVAYRGVGVADEYTPLSTATRVICHEIEARTKPASAAA